MYCDCCFVVIIQNVICFFYISCTCSLIVETKEKKEEMIILLQDGDETAYRLTQVGIFRALSRPGFFRSTSRTSRVINPAVKSDVSIRKRKKK